jgi:methyltransferase
MSLCRWLVLLVLVQRLVEVAWARRNERCLLANGGIETGASHYPLFFLLHGGWLAALWFWVPPDAPVNWAFVVFFGMLQVGRLWVILSLGRFWTTRIISVPGAALVRRGPYRWLKHPNYMIVTAEIAALPLAFGAYDLALAFSLLNLVLLRHRIRIENGALTARRTGPGHPS